MQTAVPQTTSDLTALLKSSAFAILPDRALLRITGSDATRWLNGMVTNSITALEPGEGNYNFLLNAQGRIQGDCFIFRDTVAGQHPEFLLVTDAAQLDPIQQHLDRFIIMDDVELSPAVADEATLLLLGSEAAQQLAALDLPALPSLHLARAVTPHGPVLLLAPPHTLLPRFELRAAAATIDSLRIALEKRGVPVISETMLEQVRVFEGTPRFGIDIRDRELAQETNQTHALHFAKGCYLGQEIVERIRSRGQVHRVFTGLRLEGCIPDLPIPLEFEGKPVGEITSATEIRLPDGPQILALGYVRREALEAGKPLSYRGGMAQRRLLRRAS